MAKIYGVKNKFFKPYPNKYNGRWYFGLTKHNDVDYFRTSDENRGWISFAPIIMNWAIFVLLF